MGYVEADEALAPSEELAELVRDALLHLYDPAYLQTHPLLATVGADSWPPGSRGRMLRQALLDAIEALHPAPGVAATSRAWRTYRILELRYLEGYDVAAVIDQVALSKSQYHREHQRALQAVAAVLGERRPPVASAGSGRATGEDLARLEVQQLREDGPDWIDPAEVIRGVTHLLLPLCGARGVELSLDVADRLPGIAGERVALRQALLTILAHAVNAAEGGTLAVTLAETGSAIEMLAERAAVERLDQIQLGVEQARPFVDALDGRLAVIEPADQSTRVRVRLSIPLAERPTVLVVDNNADFRRLVQLYLAGHGWEVLGAADVDRALALAQQCQPRAILLDAVLPGRDGWDLLLELKRLESTRSIPVVVCSVLDEPDVAIALGAASYLHKPVDERGLVAALQPYR